MGLQVIQTVVRFITKTAVGTSSNNMPSNILSCRKITPLSKQFILNDNIFTYIVKFYSVADDIWKEKKKKNIDK